MKIRNDFVTNSSSSSYIVSIVVEVDGETQVIELAEECRGDALDGYIDGCQELEYVDEYGDTHYIDVPEIDDVLAIYERYKSMLSIKDFSFIDEKFRNGKDVKLHLVEQYVARGECSLDINSDLVRLFNNTKDSIETSKRNELEDFFKNVEIGEVDSTVYRTCDSNSLNETISFNFPYEYCDSLESLYGTRDPNYSGEDYEDYDEDYEDYDNDEDDCVMDDLQPNNSENDTNNSINTSNNIEVNFVNMNQTQNDVEKLIKRIKSNDKSTLKKDIIFTLKKIRKIQISNLEEVLYSALSFIGDDLLLKHKEFNFLFEDDSLDLIYSNTEKYKASKESFEKLLFNNEMLDEKNLKLIISFIFMIYIFNDLDVPNFKCF